MAASLPSETQIRAAAVELGLADANGNYPRDKRAQIAAAVQLVKEEAAVQAAVDVDLNVFAQQVALTERRLLEAGVTAQTTTGVVAAIAVVLRRELKENRTHD